MRISQWKQMMTIKSLSWNVRFEHSMWVDFLVCFHFSLIFETLCPFSSSYLSWNIVFQNKRMDRSEMLLPVSIEQFISKWVPWILTEPKKSYWRVPMISGNGTEKLFATRFEILGLGGHWENKNWKKMTTKQSEEYFFHQRCEKTSTNFEMASRFWLAA